MPAIHYKNFKTGAFITLLCGVMVLTASLIIGKIPFFLALNTNLGVLADWFFRYWTNAGDGLMWIVVLIVTLYVYKRKDLLPLLISSFLLVTLFTQVCKYIIVPDAPRPVKAIGDTSLIHLVPGVDVHLISSFPSGHTAAAFSFYLLFCLLTEGAAWLVGGFLLALLVAYSRIYLAQHFPVDTGAGMVVAVISVWLAVKIQERYYRKKLAARP